jgi:type I restriction enzyme, S subunit
MKKYDSCKDSGVEWIGEIPSHWNCSNLKWYSQIYSGGTPSKDIDDYWINGTIPWLNSGSVNQEDVTEVSEYITEEALKNSSAKWIPEGALIIALAGQGKTKGMVAQVKFKTTCNQSLGVIVPNDKINNRFLLYWLRNNYQNIRNLGGGDKRDGLNLVMVGGIPLPLPEHSEQTTIANYLDQKTTQIDDLIAKKERLIQLLEEERTAIINQAVTKGLDPTVPMKDSGIEWLGEIPEHWEVKKLKYVANLISQKTSEKPEYVIALENIESWTGKIIGNPLENEMQGEAQLFEKGDVLFNKLRPYLAKVTLADKMGGAMGELLILRPNEFITSEFLFQRLRSEMIITVVDGSTYGTKMPRASWDKFISLLEFGVPTIEEQNEIVEFIYNNELTIDSITQKYQQEIELLKEYKTALISEVVTGKVDVRNEKLN